MKILKGTCGDVRGGGGGILLLVGMELGGRTVYVDGGIPSLRQRELMPLPQVWVSYHFVSRFFLLLTLGLAKSGPFLPYVCLPLLFIPFLLILTTA